MAAHFIKYICLIAGLFLAAGVYTDIVIAQNNNVRDIKFNSWLAKEPRISEINVEGNNFYSDAEIKKSMFSRKSTFWEALKTESSNRVFRYSINRDTLEIKYIYLREGFLNVSVSESFAVAEPDSTAIVNISIQENSRFLIGRMILIANDSLSFYHRLWSTVDQFKTGDAVDPIRINNAFFNLKTFYANNGYPYATVTQEVDTSLGPANTVITVTAVEGPPVVFGRLKIGSLKNYRPHLVEREIVFHEGEPYSRKKIIESRKRLYSTGMFHTLTLDVQRKATTGGEGEYDISPDFTFAGIERKPNFISIKTGAAQDSLQDLTWDFSAAWGKRNFLGSRRLELSIKSRHIIFTQWRPLSHRLQARFTEPWFFRIRMPLTLTTRFEPGVRSQVQPSRIQRWSVSLSTRKEWSQELFALITGSYENVNIYGVDTLEAAAIRDTVRARRKLAVTLVRDTRIDKFVPRQGSYTTYFVEYVGGFLGGDDGFLKLEFSWARYQQAIGPAIFATRFKAGWIKESGDSQSVPIEDRFFLGGANSIRGFRENSIGPRAGGIENPTIDSTNLGANAYAIFNQEMRFPVYGKLWASIFTDLGNGWESFSKVRPENILFSYGMGVQFLSPAGPIRLDYARRLENGIYTEDDRFHVTILYAF